MDREQLKDAKRWVVKIGSALLTDNGRGLDVAGMAAWVEQMARMQQAGKEIILVSSGSVAAGMTRLGWSQRPSSIHHLQAAAAVGQMELVRVYETLFQAFSFHTAQILLGHDDLSDRKRYLNARSTLSALIDLNVIPVVNENDTVATDEIRFGDNDTLAAMVANLIDADALLILTDQEGMYDTDPRNNPDAQLIESAFADEDRLTDMAGAGSGSLGRGGMATKLGASRLAARSGACSVIAGGHLEKVISRVMQGDTLGTMLRARQKPLAARKQWLSVHKPKGAVVIDVGAERVLRASGRSLLPVGVLRVEGEFDRGALVECVNEAGVAVARGLINYSAEDAQAIAGRSSDEFVEYLGYRADDELIHRDNLVIIE